MVVAAVLGLPRPLASFPLIGLLPAPPGPARESLGALSTTLVAGRFCLAGLAGSGRLTQTGESLNNAAARRLLVSSPGVAAVGEKLTMGLAVSR